MHLATEAKIGGPVQYRWMYPIERYLSRLKSYVRNRAYPEGSIAEGYISEECLTFCSRYLESVETVFNRPIRNNEEFTGAMLSITLDQKSMTQAHRYVLFNCDEIIPFRNVHKDRIKAQLHPRRVSDDQIHKIHMEKFCDWFREHVVLMTDAENEKLTHIVRCLARGPNNEARRLKRYVTNGLKFRTKDSEEDKKTQNSGVSVVTEGGMTYYGALTDIIELDYFDSFKYILFKCEWVDVLSGKGYKIDEFGFPLVNFKHLIHVGEKLIDEPYVLASEASQVFYVEDKRHKDWVVAVKTKARDIFDAGIGVLCDDEDDESNTYCENVPYNVIVDDTHGDVNDHLDWARPEMARKPLRTRVVTLGSSSQQAPAHENGSSSQQAPTHEKQAHHESLDVEEQLVVDAAVSGAPLKHATRGRSKYNSWTHIPKRNKEKCWEIVERRFIIPEDPRTFLAVKEWTLQKLSKMWRDRKWRMKGRKFKKNGNPTHVVAAASPHVDKVDFATLVTYWYSKDGQDLSDKNKKSCSFQKETHTAGSKSYASHVEEMKEERGVNVPIERAELYEKFYTHKDGTPVNDNAAKNIQTMNELMSDPSTQLDCTSSSGSIAWAPNDVYSQGNVGVPDQQSPIGQRSSVASHQSENLGEF
uniref:CRIB domain-containing protein n=1 Tax=Fagus sylvatica TaxID=28930 RepID=A0A2N9IH12_FAGSY